MSCHHRPSSSPSPYLVLRWGMLLAVLEGCQDDFRGFHAYYRAYANVHGLMQWQQVRRWGRIFTPPGAESCATDADLDAAYALLLAGVQFCVARACFRSEYRWCPS